MIPTPVISCFTGIDIFKYEYAVEGENIVFYFDLNPYVINN